jgi:hypothetical protein
MTLPLWGQLQKALDNSETIEEAIARVVAEHNSEPEAHMNAGESLETHKTAEVLDHPANSIVGDKLDTTGYIYHLSLLDYATWGSVGLSATAQGVMMTGGYGAGNASTIRQGYGFSSIKEYFAIARIQNVGTNLSTKRFLFGVSADEPEWGEPFLGFALDGETLYIRAVGTDDDFNVAVSGASAPWWGKLAIHLNASNMSVDFYRNGALVYSRPISEELEANINDGYLYNIGCALWRTNSGSVQMTVRELYFAT